MRSSQDTYTLANGVKMPCIGLGTYQSPDAVASAAVKDAMAAGYRLIDTAAAYGNERGVGQGIRISGVPREEIFVTSKLRNAAHGYQATLEAFDMTLSPARPAVSGSVPDPLAEPHPVPHDMAGGHHRHMEGI